MKYPKKIFIYTICCLRRRIDANKISKYLELNEYVLVDSPKHADIIIFVTCGYHDKMINTCINKIKHFKKYDAELILAGCLPDVLNEKLNEVFDGRVIPTKDLNKIDEILVNNKIKIDEVKSVYSLPNNSNIFDEKQTKDIKEEYSKKDPINRFTNYIKENILSKIPPINQIYAEQLFEKKNYKGVTLLISRGCIHNCSYCAIKKAIGPLKSVPIESILDDFKKCLNQGYKNFYLEADDIGTYGLDINTTIVDLLGKMTTTEGNFHISLGVTHPLWIIKYIKDLEKILKTGKIKSIVISVQSADDKILKLMRRAYKINDVSMSIFRLKKAYPSIKLGSQFIIGFPGETKEQFNNTYNFIKEMNFDFGAVFKYSDVYGTESCNMNPKIGEKTKNNRMKPIFKLLKKRHEYVWKTNRSIGFFKK